MGMTSSFNRIVFLCSATALLSLASCANSPGGGDDPSPVTHEISDADPTMTAITYGIVAAAGSTDPLESAYAVVAGSIVTYCWNGYTYDGITLNGSLAVDTSTFIEYGTIFTTGDNVEKIVYNNVTLSPLGGTLEITFTDNSTWAYDYATETFTQI
jgi:hypothetical protein